MSNFELSKNEFYDAAEKYLKANGFNFISKGRDAKFDFDDRALIDYMKHLCEDVHNKNKRVLVDWSKRDDAASELASFIDGNIFDAMLYAKYGYPQSMPTEEKLQKMNAAKMLRFKLRNYAIYEFMANDYYDAFIKQFNK